MTLKIENKLQGIPLVRNLMHFLKKIKLPGLGGFSLYDLLEKYSIGIIEGALSYHASSVAFSLFMALFPVALFILN
mgnify:FL=1